MADALTIQEKFGNLRGKKVAFIGDGNNVAVSLMHIVTKLGGHFSIASPEGYEITTRAINAAREFASHSGSRLRFLRDPHEAVKNADVIYTDTWTSMGQEAETQKRAAVFPPYQVNRQLVSEANQNVIVMHCLPAHRGQEITDEVADGPHSVLFPQAENRMHAQKGILVHLLRKA
jgi:ornithine carbamoyltransferase